ncbi:helix-turn-helix transcriptional regulator [Actinophytocola oryzae]|uniref:Helix-turn-helix protein n=1 Tax=Actinophytocola oryzae TaxID=502181 RepID=A0A4R7VZ82_9PSEU|nr:helix-turn-helix transcriptional regulator [Actinophytocola oryzae]TDV55372.1 helix-turn-helix protein [Actinophytocola oryzae]
MALVSPPRHLLFETVDTERAAEYLTCMYGTRFRLAVERHGYFYRHSRLAGDSFSVDRSDVNRDTTFMIDSAPVLFVARARNSNLSYRCGDVEFRLGHGDVILCNLTEHGRPFRTRLRDGAVEAAILPFSVLAEIAQTRGAEPLRFASRQPVGPAQVAHLHATIDFVSGAIRDRPEAMSEPLVHGAAGRMLAAAVLAAFPSTALTDPTPADRRDSHPATLRRAVAFVEEAAHVDISVADVASAANVTIRAVQHAFRRHLDTTPMGYVRSVRLRRAHQELLAADPATGVTVTEIAARWGFYHPGRFARYYRATYGSAPYQTMLRDAP